MGSSAPEARPLSPELEAEVAREAVRLADLSTAPAADPAEARRRLLEAARALGLEAGVAPARLADVETSRLEAWLARGDHGTMHYMAAAPAARADAASVLEGARCVLAVALPYPPELDPEAPGPVSCYARGEDYHRVLGRRLEALARFARKLLPGGRARRFVDTMPLLERAFAAAAGLGFLAKNSCLIHPRLGSYLFLGGLVLDRELPLDAPLDAAVSCGTCTRCLDACPTGALPEPHRLDARRCISYLTIEHRGPFDAALRPLVGTRVFGCDVCQAVCPWNEKFAPPGDPALAPREALSPGPLLSLLESVRASWTGLSHDSPLKRALRRGFLRNVATALASTGDEGRSGGEGRGDDELAALRELAADPDDGVREHALWALARREGSRPGEPSTGP